MIRWLLHKARETPLHPVRLHSRAVAVETEHPALEEKRERARAFMAERGISGPRALNSTSGGKA